MSATTGRAAPAMTLRLCLWCLAAIAVEIGFFLTYQGHDARFHWFTHFFVGSSAALLLMAAWTLRTRRPVSYPFTWPVAAHVLAMTPDLLFAGGRAHARWMDVFLGHVRVHYIPGRNLTWYLVFLACLAGYLFAVDRIRTP